MLFKSNGQEIQTQRVWGTETYLCLESYGNSDSGTGYVSGTEGNQPFGICRASGEENNTSVSEHGSTGGVVDELIAEVTEQLVESQTRTEKLKGIAEKLFKLKNSLNNDY